MGGLFRDPSSHLHGKSAKRSSSRRVGGKREKEKKIRTPVLLTGVSFREKIERMYSNLEEAIRAIIQKRPPVLAITVREIAKELEAVYKKVPAASTIKYALNDMGIVAVEGKKRAWRYKHNGGQE